MANARFLGGLGLVSALAVSGIVGCTKRSPEPVGAAKAPTPITASAPAPSGSAAVSEHGTRKKRNIDPPVYMDGQHVGILRHAELPPNLPTLSRSGSASRQFYRLSDYVAGLGTPLERVKAVHLMGKRRVWASVSGEELRARKDQLLFHFTRETGGKAFLDWDTTGLKNDLRLDYPLAIAIYAEKPEPKLDEQRRCFLETPKDETEDDCSNNIPYVDGEPGKGTRIYVDGRMTNIVKRRLVAEKMILEGKDSPSPHYSLARYLESVGVDTKRAKGVEFVIDDDRVVGRAIGEQWKSVAGSLAFTLPAHGHGKVMAGIPVDLLSTEANTKPRDVMVNAILVYRKATPPAGRHLFPLDPDEDGTAVSVGVASGTGYGESDEEF